MDWLRCLVMLILFAAVLVLLWKNYRIKKEAKLFAEKVEAALDAIVTGKEWKMEEEAEDSLWGRTGTQLAKAGYVFQKKEEDSIREKERVKGLISDISHQTRTPVANMKLYLELLDDEELSQNGREFLGKLKEQMEKIDFLMQSMIKMSRLETGILQIHKEDKDLYETIRHAVADVVPEAASKGIDLYVSGEENMKLRHDVKWTEEAIYNILDNAIKYTEPGGKIHIRAERQELFFRLSISDTGKGIAPERQAEIFTRFYREPEVHDKPGVGIGLYLARMIMELQNGYIEVQSETGKGACFRLYFPVKEP
ncbi:MAG: HAMP domain-containing sensor histidine kinase [Eubacteriales bacterium]|nr:HAMP domain-containing sensor histidine kinase [Eubacteriales bacterium]